MQPIAAAILTTNTNLYDPFIDGTKERGTLICLHLVNTTNADITVDVFIDMATDVFILDDEVIPAKGTVTLTGAWTVDDGAEIIKAIASATGVDATGTVVESDA
jgi:hypothetical protein